MKSPKFKTVRELRAYLGVLNPELPVYGDNALNSGVTVHIQYIQYLDVCHQTQPIISISGASD